MTWRPPRQASDELGRDIAVWETLVYTDEPGAEVSDETARRGPARTTSSRSTATPVRRSSAATPTPARPPTTAGSRRRTRSASRASTSSSRSRRRRRPTSFWDGSLREAPEIEFKEAETIEGLEVYRFEQVIPPTTVGNITAPASFFGIDEEGDVTLDRVYSNTRTLWIEPETGVIIRGQEDQLSVAEYEGEQVATLTDVTIGYNPETISDNVDTYSSLATQLKLIRIWVPLVGGILGLLLLAAGLVMLRSSRRSEAHHAA